MQVKQYLKSVAGAVFAPVVKSLSNAFPSWGAGWTMMSETKFSWSLGPKKAYNNKIFYTAANILVLKLIEVPLVFGKKKGKEDIGKFYSKTLNMKERRDVKADNIEERENHWLAELFENPNELQSGIELREDFWYNRIFGDGFFFFDTLGALSRDKRPKRVFSLNRDRVSITTLAGGKFGPNIKYEYTAFDGTLIELPSNQVMHFKRWNPNYDELKGLGVDVIAGMDVALNNANNVAQGAAFRNGGRGTAFSSKVDHDQTGKARGKLTHEQIAKIEETVRRDMAGASNNRRMIFTNGELVVTPYGDTLAEMELIKAEENNWKSIFAIMGIPWSLAPITTAATDNNIAAGYKALVTNKIISELKMFDKKLTKLLQQWDAGLVAVHDITEFTELAPDLKLMKEVYDSPPVTVDEHRSIFGHDKVDDPEIGKMILVSSGKTKIEDFLSTEFDEMDQQETPPRL